MWCPIWFHIKQGVGGMKETDNFPQSCWISIKELGANRELFLITIMISFGDVGWLCSYCQVMNAHKVSDWPIMRQG